MPLAKTQSLNLLFVSDMWESKMKNHFLPNYLMVFKARIGQVLGLNLWTVSQLRMLKYACVCLCFVCL